MLCVVKTFHAMAYCVLCVLAIFEVAAIHSIKLSVRKLTGSLFHSSRFYKKNNNNNDNNNNNVNNNKKSSSMYVCMYKK